MISDRGFRISLFLQSVDDDIQTKIYMRTKSDKILIRTHSKLTARATICLIHL